MTPQITFQYSPRPFVSRGLRLLVSLAAAAGLAGCSMGTLSLSGAAAPKSPSIALSGTVHGGQQPVSGSTIFLYAITGGTTTNLIPVASYYPGGAPGCVASGSQTCTSYPQTDANGYFTITGDYTCPAGNTSAPLYIVAGGGNPGLAAGTNNASLSLATALGPCAALGTSAIITINEVTTATAAIAFSHNYSPSANSFISPTTTIGQTGLLNAFNTANLLVNSSTGAAVTSTTLTGAGAPSPPFPRP
jgi:hypothetical protein